MFMSQSRYRDMILDGTKFAIVPFIEIPKKSTDYYIYYEQGKSRLDLISYDYYGDANYDWLIMQANPEYGSLEFNIPHHALLRIPFPLDTTIAKYKKDVKEYDTLYGLQ